MDLFLLPILHPQEFWLATAIAATFVFVLFMAAKSPERRSMAIRWVRSLTSPNTKVLFGLLLVVWAIGFGTLIPMFPNQANSPYGALALIALFSGFFLLMGFIWSVIGE